MTAVDGLTIVAGRWIGKLAAALCAGMLMAAAAWAQPPTEAQLAAARAVFDAVDRGAWDVAEATGRQVEDGLLGRLARWADLSREDVPASFEALAAFIVENPDWPAVTTMRREAERAMAPGLPPDAVIAWFEAFPPLTFDGVTRFGEALDAADPARAAPWARESWPTLRLTVDEEASFLGDFGAGLAADDHWARLDALLWAERVEEARRMLPMVGRDRRLLGEARLALMTEAPNVNEAVRAVPEALADNEGLNFERARWRRRQGDNEGAIAMLAREPEDPVKPAAWWAERNLMTRRLFENGSPGAAYELVTGAEQADSVALSEAEFLAGWLALRFLDRPSDALTHFTRLYDNVGTPVSLARGAYWAGRAAAALGDEAAARQWYETAARYPVVFYGQLAAGELGQPTIAAPPPEPPVAPEVEARFEANDFVRAIRLLDGIGQRSRADAFLRTYLMQEKPAADSQLLARLAVALDRPFIAVRAAKAALRENITVSDAGFPILPLPEELHGVEPALVLGLVRQESEFNPTAVSSAGAIGLMQLLPQTAGEVAQRLGVAHNAGMLTSDPQHNVRLGSRYLSEMIDRSDGSWIRAVAAYNAGLGRVEDWAAPPGETAAIIDWIESIPLSETRNYVQRVLENVQVYRVRLGETEGVGALEADLAR